MPMFRRRARSQLVKKRRYAKRRQMMKRRGGNGGTIRIVRKCAEQNVYNGATAGAVNASGAVVVVGSSYQTPAFVGSTYYNVPFSIDTSLSDVLNSSELIAIADKYKINWVKVQIYCTSNTASSGGTAQLPSVMWYVDEDDSVVPTASTAGLNALREHMGVKIRQFKQNGAPLTIFYRPKVGATVGGAAGAATNAIVSPSKFINCAFADIPHYGLKGYLQDVNLASTASVYTQFKFDITMSITLKDLQ